MQSAAHFIPGITISFSVITTSSHHQISFQQSSCLHIETRPPRLSAPLLNDDQSTAGDRCTVTHHGDSSQHYDDSSRPDDDSSQSDATSFAEYADEEGDSAAAEVVMALDPRSTASGQPPRSKKVGRT